MSDSSRIRILPGTLVDQIAAGEVVERPASAVKELLENALDAGARRVEIDIDGGGLARIAVSDDGSGMTAEEARISVERHATSKIRSAADLLRVSSFGFRGEALPSIASVSHFTILTSRAGSREGTKVVVDGGSLVTAEPAARPAGTTVTVLDLFANVPARRKFLRNVDTERRRAVAVVTAMSLTRSDVAFVVRADGRVVLDLAEVDGPRERILAAMGGARVLGEMASETIERQGVSATAYVGSTLFASKRNQYLFVRGRWIADRALARAVARAEADVLRSSDRHPGLFVFVDLPPEEVDVNVHPAKSEVRFRTSTPVFEVVHAAVRDALMAAKGESVAGRTGFGGRILTSAPAGPPRPPFPSARTTPLAREGDIAMGSAAPGRVSESMPAESVMPPTSVGSFPAAAASQIDGFRAFPGGRFLGQFHSTYLLVDSGASLLLLDQHVAHERVLYEATLERLRRGALPSQRLLSPLIFEAAPDERELLEAHAGELARAGFEIVEMSGGAWGIAAVPDLLKGDPVAILRELLGRSDLPGGQDEETPEPFFQVLAAKLSCRAAVMAGHPLGAAEAQRLVSDLSQTDDPFSCPHGRPTWITLDVADVERRFGRR